MAHAEHPDSSDRPARWDGAVRCVLCAGGEDRTDHDWCAAAEALVCDGCCVEMLNGEPRRMIAAAQAASRTVSPLELVAACAECTRLPRMLAEEATLVTMEDEEPGCIH